MELFVAKRRDTLGMISPQRPFSCFIDRLDHAYILVLTSRSWAYSETRLRRSAARAPACTSARSLAPIQISDSTVSTFEITLLLLTRIVTG